MKNKLITLRRYGPDDVELRYEWEATAVVRDNINAGAFESSRSDFVRFHRDRVERLDESRRVFVIESRRGRPLGLIWLVGVDWEARSAQLGVLIGPAASRGIGFGPAAVEQIIELAVNEFNLHTVCNVVYEVNEGMSRLVENVEPDIVSDSDLNVAGRYIKTELYTVIAGKRGLKW